VPQSRIPLRSFPNPKVKLQYLVFPYADFSLGAMSQQDNFQFGPFALWRDTEASWPTNQNIQRPSNLLSIYVDRDGKPLTTLWIATLPHTTATGPVQWHQLSAALFYLAWARIPFFTPDRPAAEDFYFEAFVLPEGVPLDASGHARWSKYTTTFWKEMKIYPTPEVSLRQTIVELPLAPPKPRSLFYDPTPAELFSALGQELKKKRVEHPDGTPQLSFGMTILDAAKTSVCSLVHNFAVCLREDCL
jgi:hypothetical protein